MTSSQLRTKVLQSYKQLLRAQQKTFHGDVEQLAAARAATREKYYLQKGVQDAKTLEQLVSVAEEAATFIQRNVVQAVKKGPSNSEVFSLKLDSEKEINYNDTIKQAGKKSACCSA